ncbi:MAG: DoxX family protein [Acidimicrobiia bacterium]
MSWKNTALWVLQIGLGIYFVFVGIIHFVVPDGLPGPMEWMYELSDTMHAIVGVVEILGGLGLILPSVTRIRPELTVYAALGLITVMVGAMVWHATRSEPTSIAQNVLIAVLLGIIVYGRTRVAPITAKS